MSKAYKIDSDNRTVTEIFILGTGSERLQQLQQEVGGHIEVAAYLENNDAVYVNEEGMYCLPEDKGWFWLELTPKAGTQTQSPRWRRSRQKSNG